MELIVLVFIGIVAALAERQMSQRHQAFMQQLRGIKDSLDDIARSTEKTDSEKIRSTKARLSKSLPDFEAEFTDEYAAAIIR